MLLWCVILDKIWSSYVEIPFILCGSTATSSARGDYVAVLEPLGQNEEQAGKKEERTRKKPCLFPKEYLPNTLTLETCKIDLFIILCILFYKY